MASRVVTKWTCPGCGAPRDEPFANCPDCGGHKNGLPAYHCESHGDLAGPVCPTCVLADQRCAKLKEAEDCLAHGHWRKATVSCDELIAECPGFPGVDECRRKAVEEGERRERERRDRERRDTEIQEREAREQQDREQRASQRSAKFADAEQHMARGHWRKALELCDELDGEDDGFPGVGDLRRQATEYGERRGRERQEHEACKKTTPSAKLTLAPPGLHTPPGKALPPARLHMPPAIPAPHVVPSGATTGYDVGVALRDYFFHIFTSNLRINAAMIIGLLVFGALGWWGISTGIAWKRKGDFARAVAEQQFAQAAAVAVELAGRWQPAAKFQEYWQARTEFEAALEAAGPAACKQVGDKLWTAMEAQKKTGEESVDYPYEAARDAYRGATAKLAEMVALVGKEKQIRDNVMQDFGEVSKKWSIGDTLTSIMAPYAEARRRQWQQAAAAGLREAQWLWAMSLQNNGPKTVEDATEAFSLLSKAAAQQLPIAITLVGIYMREGVGCTQDEKGATEWFRKGAEAGDAGGQVEWANLLLAGKLVPANDAEAFKWLKASADQGSLLAAARLGQAYYFGWGTPASDEAAEPWLRKAADAGWPAVHYLLGAVYFRGDGVVKRPEEAVKWLTAAAEKGHAGAQNDLGNCYSEGNGVRADAEKAFGWYLKAAEQGIAEAQCSVGFCYTEGTGTRTDVRKARDWFERSAQKGYVAAMNNLGILLRDSFNDREAAKKWFRQAAAQGHTGARGDLEDMLAAENQQNQTRVVQPSRVQPPPATIYNRPASPPKQAPTPYVVFECPKCGRKQTLRDKPAWDVLPKCSRCKTDMFYVGKTTDQ